MSFSSWLRSWKSSGIRPSLKRSGRCSLAVESLEDRWAPAVLSLDSVSGSYQSTYTGSVTLLETVYDPSQRQYVTQRNTYPLSASESGVIGGTVDVNNDGDIFWQFAGVRSGAFGYYYQNGYLMGGNAGTFIDSAVNWAVDRTVNVAAQFQASATFEVDPYVDEPRGTPVAVTVDVGGHGTVDNQLVNTTYSIGSTAYKFTGIGQTYTIDAKVGDVLTFSISGGTSQSGGLGAGVTLNSDIELFVHLGAPRTIATPTVVVAPVTTTYDGNHHGTTGEAYGVNGEDLGPVAITYDTANGAAPVDAGTYTATGTFPGNLDYTRATGTATIKINLVDRDIQLDGVSWSPNGDGALISYTIKGDLSGGPAYIDLLWGSLAVPPEDGILTANFPVNPTPGSHQYHVSKTDFVTALPSTMFGDKFTADSLIAYADRYRAVPESNENNNIYVLPLSYSQPQVTLIAATKALAGQDINASLYIRNPNPYPINVKADLVVQGDVLVKGLDQGAATFSGRVNDNVTYAIPTHQITWNWISIPPPDPVSDALHSAALEVEKIKPASLARQRLAGVATLIQNVVAVLQTIQLELTAAKNIPFTRTANYSITTDTGFGATQTLTQAIQVSIPPEAVGWYNTYLRDLRIVAYSGLALIGTKSPYATALGIISTYVGELEATEAYEKALAASGLSG